MNSIGLLSAGSQAEIDRYIGYWKPYATSHADLDADQALQKEVENAARVLAIDVLSQRAGRGHDSIPEPRKK
jgi:hypothetical protein